MARQTRPPQERLVDLAAFFIGYAAFDAWVGQDDTARGPLAGRHLADGDKKARRYIAAMSEQLEALEPIVAEFSSVMPYYRRALRRQAPLEMGKAQAAFFSIFLLRLSKRQPLMREAFPGRSLRVAMKLAQAAQAESATTLLAACAGLTPLSGLRVTKNWLRKAAELAGVGPTEIEAVTQDARMAADLAGEVKAIDQRLLVADPMTPEAVELSDERDGKLADIQAIADESPRPEVVLSHAVDTIAQEPQFEHATETGRAQTLSPPQEDAMMVQGRAIIAAGAGSGKTRVLAAKVVYHIKELGLDPSQIMATSFSRKSAAELLARINRYGGDISGDAAQGFGTTHSIAGKLLMRNGAGRRGGVLKSHEGKTLVRLAMEQVMMKGGEGMQVPQARGLLDGLFRGAPAGAPGGGSPAAPAVEPEPEPAHGLTFEEALRAAHDHFQGGNWRNGYYRWLAGFLSSFFNPRDQWYRSTMRKTDNLRNPDGLSPKQKQNVQRAFEIAGVNYHPKRDPNLMAGGRRASTDIWADLPKSAAIAPPETKTKGQRKEDDRLRRKYKSFSQPVGQWFNRDLDLTEETKDGKGKQQDRSQQQQKRKLMPPGEFARAISKFKGQMLSPTEAWHRAVESDGPGGMASAKAAVYAAYEFLKGGSGEPEFRDKGDFDDILIDVSKLMLRNPRILRQMQSQYKCILVDEAQDLNRAQHIMFGLISGYLDPAKVHNIGQAGKIGELARDDGEMTADTYAFIGDDKQAIYEFRGADPEVFIDMSDLVEGGAGFSTKILDMNYRSGSDIVDAANALIANNDKQIPMTCRANVDRKGRGRIVSELVMSTEEGAALVAAQVAERIGDGSVEELSAGDFGIALRTNAEAYAYGLEMIKKGIPFKSKANFFNDPNTKALIFWLQLADEGVHGDEKKINEAVKNCVGAPKSFLGRAFKDGLEDRGRGNLLQWLAEGGAETFRSARNVHRYLDNLLTIARSNFSSGTDALEAILELAGADGTTIEDAMIDKIRDNDDAMSELAAESDNGVVTEDMIRSKALAPIDPLTGLMESRETLQGSMEYVRQLRAANAKLSSRDDADTIDVPAVTISTMHGWKGLEVPHLFVPMRGRFFPRAEDEDELASERRLAYVALTRGESSVTVLDIPHFTKDHRPIHSQFISEACIQRSGTPREASGGRSMTAYTEEDLDAAIRGDMAYFDRMYGIDSDTEPVEPPEWQALPKVAEIPEPKADPAPPAPEPVVASFPDLPVPATLPAPKATPPPPPPPAETHWNSLPDFGGDA